MARRDGDRVPRAVAGRRGVHRAETAPRRRTPPASHAAAAHPGGRREAAQVEPIPGREDGSGRRVCFTRSADPFALRTWGFTHRVGANDHEQASSKGYLTE